MQLIIIINIYCKMTFRHETLESKIVNEIIAANENPVGYKQVLLLII
jgi:hypothetical protein